VDAQELRRWSRAGGAGVEQQHGQARCWRAEASGRAADSASTRRKCRWSYGRGVAACEQNKSGHNRCGADQGRARGSGVRGWS
jgi:hypothetical protein